MESHDFSKWDGTPLFEGAPAKGRHAYVAKGESTFNAYLGLDGASHALARVQGPMSLLERFLEEMGAEGAHVSYGSPPFDTNTPGDKPQPGSTKPGGK